MRYTLSRLALVFALLATTSSALQAQSMKDRLKKKAQDRAETKADGLIDKLLDQIENAIKCVSGDDECVAQAKKDGKKVVMTDDDGVILPPAKQPAGSPAKNADAVAAANAKREGKTEEEPPAAPKRAVEKPGEGAFANFDFVPGERILFADDFSRDRVGNFPQRLELMKGNLQIVESKGKRWLESTSLDAEIAIPLPEVLPQRFTIEFDFTFPGNFPLMLYSAGGHAEEELGEGAKTPFLYFGPYSAGIHISNRTLTDVAPRVGDLSQNDLPGTPAHARIHVDGKYIKLYINETRIANAPNGEFGRARKIYIQLPFIEEHPVMIGNISVNAGGRDMYDALLADGRVVTQGILFDVGSDNIRGESTPTLKIIGDMLKDHADLKLTVEGHTDNTGNAAANQTLSEKRAKAIVAYLTSTYGVEASRLQSAGFGASKPSKPNDTAEGRQQNRRVELVRRAQ
ncbi:MAG TPA: OmpA family protein [Longimicrobiales bacterium]|nr:OmpA family protein [Longimicrobiales bacterium]